MEVALPVWIFGDSSLVFTSFSCFHSIIFFWSTCRTSADVEGDENRYPFLHKLMHILCQINQFSNSYTFSKWLINDRWLLPGGAHRTTAIAEGGENKYSFLHLSICTLF
jgi:hypothetical protein